MGKRRCSRLWPAMACLVLGLAVACSDDGEGTLPLYEHGDGFGDGQPGGTLADGVATGDVPGGVGLTDGVGRPLGDGASADSGGLMVDGGSGGGQPDVVWTGMPEIEVKIDGAAKTAMVFEYDPNPQTQPAVMKAKVEIGNYGDVALNLKAIKFKSETAQIALTWWDKPLGPADYPYTIQPFTTLTLSVEFTVKPTLSSAQIATLEILSDDPQHPNVALTFATPCTGAKPALTPATVELINAAPYKPRTACFKIGNVGCKPWYFASAKFEPDNGAWSVYTSPPVNDQIQEIGAPANPWAKPKKLEICVRFQPKKAGDPSATKLVISGKESFGGPATFNATASLKGIWQPESSFRLDCGGPAALDFGAVAGGPTSLSCTVINEGPATMTLNSLVLEPATEHGQQSLIDAAFSAAIGIPGQPKALALPFTLGAGQGVKMQVTWQPKTADPPPARAVLAWRQGGDEGTLQVPVHAGPCNEAAPVASPLPMGFHSPSGQTKTAFELANWSCAPLKITKHCTTLYNVTQFSACETGAPSTEYSVAGTMPALVPAWGSVPIAVHFNPGGGSRKDHLGQLHLFFCPGQWDGGKCSMPIDRIEVQLEGNTLASVTPPSLQLVAPVGIKVGHAARFVAKVTPGSHDIGMFGAFSWTITKRPPGSRAWIWGGPTDGNELLFVPDLAGSYTLSANVAAFTAGDLASQSYSAAATLDFAAAP